MTLDIAVIDKRIAELRADDAAMRAVAPWSSRAPAEWFARNSLASTADMLEQLRDEVAKWKKIGGDVTHTMCEQAQVREDILREEIDAAHAEIERMRPVVDAACAVDLKHLAGDDAVCLRCAINSYRASKP